MSTIAPQPVVERRREDLERSRRIRRTTIVVMLIVAFFYFGFIAMMMYRAIYHPQSPGSVPGARWDGQPPGSGTSH